MCGFVGIVPTGSSTTMCVIFLKWKIFNKYIKYEKGHKKECVYQ